MHLRHTLNTSPCAGCSSCSSRWQTCTPASRLAARASSCAPLNPAQHRQVPGQCRLLPASMLVSCCLQNVPSCKLLCSPLARTIFVAACKRATALLETKCLASAGAAGQADGAVPPVVAGLGHHQALLRGGHRAVRQGQGCRDLQAGQQGRRVHPGARAWGCCSAPAGWPPGPCCAQTEYNAQRQAAYCQGWCAGPTVPLHLEQRLVHRRSADALLSDEASPSCAASQACTRPPLALSGCTCAGVKVETRVSHTLYDTAELHRLHGSKPITSFKQLEAMAKKAGTSPGASHRARLRACGIPGLSGAPPGSAARHSTPQGCTACTAASPSPACSSWRPWHGPPCLSQGSRMWPLPVWGRLGRSACLQRSAQPNGAGQRAACCCSQGEGCTRQLCSAPAASAGASVHAGGPPQPVDDPPGTLPGVPQEAKGAEEGHTRVPSLQDLGYTQQPTTAFHVRAPCWPHGSQRVPPLSVPCKTVQLPATASLNTLSRHAVLQTSSAGTPGRPAQGRGLGTAFPQNRWHPRSAAVCMPSSGPWSLQAALPCRAGRAQRWRAWRTSSRTRTGWCSSRSPRATLQHWSPAPPCCPRT